MIGTIRVALVFSLLTLAVATVNADTPKTLAGPHGHGKNVTGNITLFRAQTEGLEIGDKKDFLDAEVLVTLDSEPGKVFGIRYHENKPANGAIIDTLREAYINNKPVTIQHRFSPGKTNLKIIWVQLGGMPSFASE